MSEHQGTRVLIVGAGSMGIIVGYHLELAGADVTFLVRPHRVEELSRPQILYCHDDNQLKEYHPRKFITDPYDMIRKDYKFILIALDAASLQNNDGWRLLIAIGSAARNTTTKVILGSVFFNLRPWFIHQSTLADIQVANGYLLIHTYPTKGVTLPVHPPMDPELVAKADFAYNDRLGHGIMLDDDAPAVANGFAELYNACGVSKCAVKPALEMALTANPIFAVYAASQLLDWPNFQDIGSKGELWTLAVAAVKEIQLLSIHGEAGQQAANETSEEALAASLAAWEKQMLPLDLQAFNRFHHGNKVNDQDRKHLRACLAYGEAEGKPMSSLRELIERVESQ